MKLDGEKPSLVDRDSVCPPTGFCGDIDDCVADADSVDPWVGDRADYESPDSLRGPDPVGC